MYKNSVNCVNNYTEVIGFKRVVRRSTVQQFNVSFSMPFPKEWMSKPGAVATPANVDGFVTCDNCYVLNRSENNKHCTGLCKIGLQ